MLNSMLLAFPNAHAIPAHLYTHRVQVKYVTVFEEEGHSTEEMKQEIQKHLKRKRQVLSQIPYFVSVGNYSVDCHNFRYRRGCCCA